MIGIVHIADEMYITDRDNAARIPVERVELKPTWDIDRAGSKGQVAATADAGVLEPGMWLSTYRTITPERGEVIRYPRGHWHLSRPGIAYPGGHEMDTGNVAVMQTASGSDIVDDIAGVLLTEPFYTPRGGLIMHDVRNLVQIATCGIMGPNLVTNGGFEDGLTGWTSGGSGAGDNTALAGSLAGVDIPEGSTVARIRFNAGATSAQSRYLQRTVTIPPNTRYLYLSAIAYNFIDTLFETLVQAAIVTSSGTVYRNAEGYIHTANGWYRHFGIVEMPPEWSEFRIYTLVRPRVGGPAIPAQSHVLWDDVRVGTCTLMPLPDSRINLPPSTTAATTRIQTAAGKSIGYDAINADRLSAISHYAIATDMDGRLTTRPMRTLVDAMPQYTFGPDDLALIGDVEIPATSVRPHNHWMAIKEDFEDASASLRADSYNNNANDPFSVANSGSVYSAPPIAVQDAVDQAALQAIADRARDTYSMNETVRFACMPLPGLDVYSVIAIDDPDMPHVSGKWAVNSIDASGDYLVITATRAVSREV